MVKGTSPRASMGWCAGFIGCVLLSGCNGTAAELEQATDFLSDGVPKLVDAQIFHNYLLKTENPDRLPAQVVIGSGSTQVSNQLILPSATAYLSDILFRTFGLQNQNQWQQGWSVAAVVDVGDLKRLDALYQYATNHITICEFVRSYNKAYISNTTASSLRLSDITDRKNGLYADYQTAPSTDIISDSPPLTTNPRTSPAKAADNYTVFHHFGPPALLPFPPQSAAKKCGQDGQLNLDTEQWSDPLPSRPFIQVNGNPPKGWKDMGQHEQDEFYVEGKAFKEFELWILGATVNTTKSSSSPPVKGISGSNG